MVIFSIMGHRINEFSGLPVAKAKVFFYCTFPNIFYSRLTVEAQFNQILFCPSLYWKITMNIYDVFWKDSGDYINQFCGKTPSQAKAECFRYLAECGYEDFFEVVKFLRVKLNHKWHVSDLFKTYGLERFQNQRGLPFVLIGMRVEACGVMGTICGINHSMNLDICIDGDYHTNNFHPHHKMKYFNNGELIKSYEDD
jgi:hypothetical protein